MLYNVHAVRLAVYLKSKIYGGGQKLANRSEPFLDQSSPNLGVVCRGMTVDWQVFSDCWCHVPLQRLCSVKVQSRSQKTFLPPARER